MVNVIKNPYIGPRTFEEKDSQFFYGREREARDLLSLVISEPLTLFYAQSGAGKSSLINTRLVPGLRREGFEVLPIGRVSGELPAGISEVGNIYLFNLLLSLDQSQEAGRLTHTSLSDYLKTYVADPVEHQDSPEPARVLIIDQFEEIFTEHLDCWQDREDFFRQLDQAMQRDPLLWLVLTLREDYVAALDPYARLLPGKLRARFYMQRMGYEAALQAVKRPAAGHGRPFAAGVAEALVDNLRQIQIHGQAEPRLGEFVEPVQLQVVCYQLWENLSRRLPAEITYQDLQELGDVDTALAEFYEEAIAEVLDETEESEIELRNWFERQLITESGTRGTVYRGEEKTGGLNNGTVELLANQFLLRAEVRAGGTWYELVHDRFIEPIIQANRVWRGGQSGLVRSALAWEESGRDADNLYRGQRLEAALASVGLTSVSLTKVRGQKLEPLVEEFLTESEKLNRALEEKEAARQRELEQAQALAEAERRRAEEQAEATRRLRRFAIALAVVFLLAVGAALIAWTQGQRAQHEAAEAEAARQVAEDEALARGTAQAQAEARQVEAEAAQGTAVAARATAEADREAVARQSRTLLAQVLIDQTPRILEQTNDTELATLLSLEALRLNRIGQADAQVEELVGNSLREVLGTDHFNIILTGHKDRVNVLAFSPDGQTLASASGNPEFATGSDDYTVLLWDTSDPSAPPFPLTGHEDKINSVAFSPDGLTLASGSDDRSIRVWDLKDPRAAPLVLDSQPDRVNSVAFSPSGQTLASGGDQTIWLWDVRDASKPPTILNGHGDRISSVAFSPDGETLASASDDQTIRIWDVRDLNADPILLEGHQGKVNWLAFSPDTPEGTGGLTLASGGDDNQVLVWDLSDPTAPPMPLEGHTGPVTGVAFSPDGETLASSSVDLTTRLWDVRDPSTPPEVLEGHKETVSSVAFSPSGLMLASGSHDRSVRLWELSPSAAVSLRGHTDWVRSVAYSPDGRSLASGSDDQTIRLWDVRDPAGSPIVLEGHEDQVTSVAFSPDTPEGTGGQTLASGSGSDDLTIRLWDAASGRPLGEPLTGHLNRINSVAFSPDGQYLASGSDDNQVRLWDLGDPGATSIRLTGHTDGVKSVAFSPDGATLASGSDDKTIRLWDVATGQPLGEPLTGHLDRVNAVAFSPDGLTLASGSHDKTVRLWDLRDPSAPPTILTSLNARILSVAFSPDALTLAAGGDDRRIRLWDLGDLTVPPALLAGHKDWVSSVVFSPDGITLASGSFDGTARLWATQIDTLVDIACQQVHRNLTPVEWQTYLIDEAYHQTCSNLPVPPGVVGEGSE